MPRRLTAFLRGEDLRPDQLDGGREIRLIGLIVVVGVVLASMFHVGYGLVVKWHYPYNTFLYNPHRTFMDFIDVWNAAIVYGPSERHSVTVYSPFSHLVLTLLTHVPAVIVFTAMNVGFCITLAFVLWRGVTRRIGNRRLRWIYVAVFSFLSYPVLCALQLGNIELVMFILLAAFVYLYYEKRSAWAWFPLSVAVAGKYWYAVFLVALGGTGAGGTWPTARWAPWPPILGVRLSLRASRVSRLGRSFRTRRARWATSSVSTAVS